MKYPGSSPRSSIGANEGMDLVLKDLALREVSPPGQLEACGIHGAKAGVEVGAP